MAKFLPIIYKCNLKCIFCSAEDYKKQKKDLPICELSRFDEEYVQISGGEPLLFSDKKLLLSFLAKLKKENKIIEFQTNGVLIESEQPFVKKICKFVDLFNINFSAHNPEIDYAVCGIKKAFSLRERGVDFILKNGSNVRLTFVVNKINYKHLEDFVTYVYNRFPGVKTIQFSFVKAIGAATLNRKVVPHYKDVTPFLKKALAFCVANNLTCAVDHVPICFLGKFKKFHIDYQKLMSGEKGVFLTEKKHVSQCRDCEMKNSCPGPRMDYMDIYKKI